MDLTGFNMVDFLKKIPIIRLKGFLIGQSPSDKKAIREYLETNPQAIYDLMEWVSTNPEDHKRYAIGFVSAGTPLSALYDHIQMVYGPFETFEDVRALTPPVRENSDFYILRCHDDGRQVPIRKWLKTRWTKLDKLK